MRYGQDDRDLDPGRPSSSSLLASSGQNKSIEASAIEKDDGLDANGIDTLEKHNANASEESVSQGINL